MEEIISFKTKSGKGEVAIVISISKDRKKRTVPKNVLRFLVNK